LTAQVVHTTPSKPLYSIFCSHKLLSHPYDHNDFFEKMITTKLQNFYE